MTGGIDDEPILVFGPTFAGVFERGETLEVLEPRAEVVGIDENGEVDSKLFVTFEV